MDANQYWLHRNTPEGNTTALRKPTPQDIRRALPDVGVDYRVEQATERE